MKLSTILLFVSLRGGLAFNPDFVPNLYQNLLNLLVEKHDVFCAYPFPPYYESGRLGCIGARDWECHGIKKNSELDFAFDSNPFHYWIYNGMSDTRYRWYEKCCDWNTTTTQCEHRHPSTATPLDLENCDASECLSASKENCNRNCCWWTLGSECQPLNDLCQGPPYSMNGKKFGKGCPGAVYSSGEANWSYCTNDDGRFPWWQVCCWWNEDENKCKKKSQCSEVESLNDKSEHFVINTPGFPRTYEKLEYHGPLEQINKITGWEYDKTRFHMISPNYYKETQIHCASKDWLITLPKNHGIGLTMLDCDLDLGKQTITVFDLNDGDSDGVQIGCQTVKREINSNRVRIRYETNDKKGGNLKGFSLEYYGIISKPKGPQPKTVHEETISLHPNRMVVVNVKTLKISNCRNYLQFEGTSTANMTKFCTMTDTRLAESTLFKSISNTIKIKIKKSIFDAISLEYFNRPTSNECEENLKGNKLCVNMAEAYDPHWSIDPTLTSKKEFKTTTCKGAVYPSQFVDLKFHCSKDCLKLDDLKDSYKNVYCVDGCQTDNGLCNCPPEPYIHLPKRWYIQYEGRIGPYCNTCRKPNRKPELFKRKELSVTPTKLCKNEYKYQFACKVRCDSDNCISSHPMEGVSVEAHQSGAEEIPMEALPGWGRIMNSEDFIMIKCKQSGQIHITLDTDNFDQKCMKWVPTITAPKDCEIASNGIINPIGQSTSEEKYPTNDDLFHHEFSTDLAPRMKFHGTQWIQLRPEYKEAPIDCLNGSFDATNFGGWHIQWF